MNVPLTRETPQEPLVLLVEDEPALTRMVRRLLESEGFCVITASDGRRAIELARHARPSLIVLDLGLPLMSGEEVVSGLMQALGDPPPILVMSAAETVAERAERLGAAAYIDKPFDLDDLTAAAHRAMARA
jgi:DNA-binding response OmpR family regulator